MAVCLIPGKYLTPRIPGNGQSGVLQEGVELQLVISSTSQSIFSVGGGKTNTIYSLGLLHHRDTATCTVATTVVIDSMSLSLLMLDYVTAALGW